MRRCHHPALVDDGGAAEVDVVEADTGVPRPRERHGLEAADDARAERQYGQASGRHSWSEREGARGKGHAVPSLAAAHPRDERLDAGAATGTCEQEARRE